MLQPALPIHLDPCSMHQPFSQDSATAPGPPGQPLRYPPPRPRPHRKKRAEEELQRSGIPYTIVRPGGLKTVLKSGEAQGNIVMGGPGTFGVPPTKKSGAILRSQVGQSGRRRTPFWFHPPPHPTAACLGARAARREGGSASGVDGCMCERMSVSVCAACTRASWYCPTC